MSKAATGATTTSDGTGATGDQQQQQQTPPAGDTGKTAEAAAADAAAATAAATADAAKAGATGDQGTQGGAPAATVETKTGAPEKYALTLPDGGYLEAGDLAEIEKIARANDWTNDEAQSALTEHAAALKVQSDRWLEATKADKDYGGEKLVETQRLANAVITRLRPEGHPRRDAFMRFVNRGGAFNHPEVVSFLADLGKMMGEDSATGGNAPRTVKSTTQKFYDHPTSVQAEGS